MPLIKATFTSDEAALLTGFPNKENYLGDLAALKKIGCGVCAHKCPSKSLCLERKEIIHDPPRDRCEYKKNLE